MWIWITNRDYSLGLRSHTNNRHSYVTDKGMMLQLFLKNSKRSRDSVHNPFEDNILRLH